MTMMLQRPVEAVDETTAGLLPGMPTPAEFLAMDHVGRRNAVLGFIQANPGLHEQRSWGQASAEVIKSNGYVVDVSCGTTACLAGWAVLFAGARPTLRPGYVHELLVEETEEVPVVHWETVIQEGVRLRVSEYARELLGLDKDQADHLFWGYNDRADLAEMIGEINAGVAICNDCPCGAED